jgi:hypothetical protein
VAAAISSTSISSTKRNRKTVLCLSERLPVASQTACTCSLTESRGLGRSAAYPQSSRPAAVTSTAVLPRALPELQAAVAGVVAHQIDGDLHQPRADAGLATKAIASFICPEKAILRQRFGRVAIPQGCQREAKNPQPVEAHHGLEIVQLARTRYRGCHPFDRELGSIFETV